MLIRAALLSSSFALLLSVGQAVADDAPTIVMGKPSNLADLVDQVANAVVNISATETLDAKAGGEGQDQAQPDVPKGTPFDDFFDQFFKQRGLGGAPAHPRKQQSLGSGFVIDPSGIVITNNHVVGEAQDIVVIFTDGRKLKAKVIGKDPKVDVAVLKVESDKPFKTVAFGDSDKVRVGDGVMAVGNPFGLGETVTAGILSARNRDIDSGPYDDFLQTDASINKGNSGGPLFNLKGEVIGIDTAILSPSGGSIGIGFATPSNTVGPVIDQLRQFHETRRGWLGVRIQSVDDSIAESLQMGDARGALVAGVDPKGPAKPAGLETGDVIIKFDGKDIKESRDLPRIVANTPVGKEVDVIFLRNKQEMTKKVTVGRLEDGEKVAAADVSATPEAKADAKPTVALGLELSGVTDAIRKTYSLKPAAKGVVVTKVTPNSNAADKGLQPGDVVQEVNQVAVEKPTDFTKAIDGLKKAGKKTALLLVANADGDVRFVALALE